MLSPPTFHLRVWSDLEALAQVLAWFDQFQPTLPHQAWLECQLALAEGFVNVVRHAHPNYPPNTPIDIEVAQSDRLEIRIWDYGAGFDLEQARLVQADASAEGGRGLQLMQRLADRVSYDRVDERRNCLLLIKHIQRSLR